MREYDYPESDLFPIHDFMQLANFNSFDQFMSDKFQSPWDIIKDGDPR